MAPVGSVGQSTIPPNQVNTDQTTQTDPTTGSGAIGQNGAVPPTDGSPPPPPAYAAMMASLLSIMPQMSDDQQEVVLAEVTKKLKDMEDKSDKDQVGVDSDKKRASLAEKEGKLAEASKKIEKAIYDREHASIWDKIKAVFMAIAAAIMVIVGALLTPFCPFAGPLLIVAGITCAVMAIDDIVKLTTGLGIAGNLDKLVHPNDPDSWAKADMGFGIAMAVVGAATMIVGMFTGAGEAELAGLVAKVADLAEMSVDAAATGLKVAQMAEKVWNLVSGVVDATTTVASGVYSYEATTEDAGAKTLQGEAKEKQALMQQLDEFIDMAIKRLISAADRFNSIMDSITDAMKDKADTLQHAKLIG